MKKFSGFSFAILFLTGIILFFFSSCVTQKQVKYLQKKQKTDTINTYNNRRTLDYRIKQLDNLYIRIFTMDEKSNTFLNQSKREYNVSDINIYLDSYVVNDSGYIDFPMIGNIYVKDLRVDQAKNVIQSLVREYLKDAQVTVKMVNFTVTILGEIRYPGKKPVYQDKINIFEAISLAGDLTEFADRSKVALIRQIREGSRVVYLDLNSIEILRSEYFYLEPNDILYFSPLRIKRWGFGEAFPWAFVFSTISFALVLITYFKK